MSLSAFQSSIPKILEVYFKNALYSDIVQRDHKDEMKYLRFYTEVIKILILNKDQLALTLFLVDKFLDCHNEKNINKYYHSINDLFDIAISTTHKLTQDFCFSDHCLRKLFKNDDLTKLENHFYDLIDFDFELKNPIIQEYYEYFLIKYC